MSANRVDDAWPPTDIDRRIAARAQALTPTERRIAAVVTKDQTTLAFNTVAQFAAHAGTSGPTVVRFATKLGFAGYGELQTSARRTLTERLNSPTQRLRRQDRPGHSLARSAIMTAVESAFEQTEGATMQAMAAAIAEAAGGVWIIASETSSPIGHSLAANLALVRKGVRHLTGSGPSIVGEIVDADRHDVVIAVDFERYERAVTTTATRLHAAGATILAITDGPLAPLARVSTLWVAVSAPAVGPFDSALPALTVAETLTATVASLLRDQATSRLQRIEDGWTDYDVFEAGSS